MIFGRDPLTGLLTYRESGPAVINGGRGVVIHPDGLAAYATSYTSPSKVTALIFGRPAPVINTVGPASRPAGSAASLVTVNGADFHPASVVRVNGADRATNYLNASQLAVTLTDADLAAAGALNLTVFTPAPGGGLSNAAVFTVLAPGAAAIPAVESVSLAGGVAGGGPATLDVRGADFAPGAQVLWNGAALPTTFINAQRLTAAVAASDLAQPGPVVITVQNPATQSLEIQATAGSAPVALTVVPPNLNPPPGVDGIAPTQANAAGAAAAVEVAVLGVNFVPGSQALWNGQARPTIYVNGNLLRMLVSASDLTLPGSAGVTVQNPAAGGGGTSNAETFTILNPVTVYVVNLPMVRR